MKQNTHSWNQLSLCCDETSLSYLAWGVWLHLRDVFSRWWRPGVEVKTTSWWLTVPWVTVVHWNGIFFSSKETEITTDRTPGTKPVGECLLWDSLISKFFFPIKSFIICCSMCGQRFEDFFQGACYRGSVWMQRRQSVHWALAETQAFKLPGTALVALLA